ncbi:hypothetical protein JCM9279_000213 [Rhodotorula babjevae]
MANNNQAPPGASPHAEECTRLESLVQALDAAAAASSTELEIVVAAGQANILLPATVTVRSQALLQPGALNAPAKLTTARATVTELSAYAKGQVDLLRRLPPAPLPYQDGLSDLNAQKEVSCLFSQAASMPLPKGAKPHDLVRKIEALYQHATSFVKQYPSDKEVKEVTAYKLLAAAASASSIPQIAQWWDGPGKRTSWDNHLAAAKRRLLTHVEETVQQVSERFTKAANSFDWLKEYKNDDDVAILPSVMYAARLSSILANVPGKLGTGGWPFAAAAKSALPHWLDVKLEPGKDEDPQQILAAIQRLPKDVFRKRKEALAEMRSLMTTAPASTRSTTQGTAQPQRATSTQVFVPLPSEHPSAQQGRMPPYWVGLSNANRRSYSVAQASPVTFPDTQAGRDGYAKAVAAFIKTQGESPPLSARFPLKPGTATVPSAACDKCGMSGHIANSCPAAHAQEVPMAERNYRRQWRLVGIESSHARGGVRPKWLTLPEKQVNLIGEIDQLMAYEEALCYPSQDNIDAALEAGKA